MTPVNCILLSIIEYLNENESLDVRDLAETIELNLAYQLQAKNQKLIQVCKTLQYENETT